MNIFLTINQDFNEQENGPYCHVHSLIDEFEQRGHNVFAIGPAISKYHIQDNQAAVESVYKFCRIHPTYPMFGLIEADIDPNQKKLGDLLLIQGYDETNRGIDLVNEYQTNFLLLLAKRFSHIINDPTSERFTLKHNLIFLETEIGIPLIPTTQLQDLEQLNRYIQTHKRIIVKPTNSACGAGVTILNHDDKFLNSKLRDGASLDHLVFQPLIPAQSERQVFFIDGVVQGVVEFHYNPEEPLSRSMIPPSVCEPSDSDIETVRKISQFTGLQIGRVDFLNYKDGSKNRRVLLELNGSGSGQVYISPDGILTDITSEVVTYCEEIVSGKRERMFFPQMLLLS